MSKKKTYELNEEQIKALVKWATARTTGWGPSFSGAFKVAQDVDEATRKEQG